MGKQKLANTQGEAGEGKFMIYHKPALLQEVLEYLKPESGGLYIDATVGGGGHAEAILKTGAQVLAIDRDPEAIEFVKRNLDSDNLKNLTLVNGNFAKINQIAKSEGFKSVDGILLDLGVSSHQLDEAQRGFSINFDGPLDMRMDKIVQIKAEDIVNNFDERRLYEIFKTYGEERYSRSIANAIVSARRLAGPISTTRQLAQIVSDVVTRSVRKKGHIHPATKVFMALRIVVNSETLNLNECLPQTVSLLKNGGRLVVISFHSLEDGIVKRFFKSSPNLKVLTERPIGPTALETETNPRARSAKLRVAEKIVISE